MKLEANIEEIDYQLRRYFPSIPVPGPRDILGMAEEIGEFVGAYNKMMGESRNLVQQWDFEMEWADVIITTMLAGQRFFGDRTQTILEEKMQIILSRGWKNHD